MNAKINMFKLGGIRSPKTEELEINAAEWPLGYPAAFILGSITEPMQDKVAMPLPEMAPNSAQATTITTPKPPLIRPTKISANPTRASPMPPFSIRLPARMNNGMATSTAELALAYPYGTRNI